MAYPPVHGQLQGGDSGLLYKQTLLWVMLLLDQLINTHFDQLINAILFFKGILLYGDLIAG